ncbi:MAG: alginate lyase family protein [Mucilaginibacter sp.]
MNKLSWYYHRFKTMSVPEVFFRAKQVVNNSLEKLSLNIPQHQKFIADNKFKFKADDFIRNYQSSGSLFAYFDSSIDTDKPINFHLDTSTGRSFPIIYAKSINMRTDEYGNAKLVWEVNRLQFLLPIVIEYSNTLNKNLLYKFITVMESWKQQNPYLKGINWYSNIEVNIRLINWYWCWVILDNIDELRADMRYQAFKSDVWIPLIYQHCYYSYKNPSLYSSANNHLTSEYAGLFVASSIWKFPQSDKWLNYAKAGLEREIVKQHSNGINREEAAGYIQFITDLFLLPYITGQQQGIQFSKVYEDTLADIGTYINNLLDVKGNFPKYGDEDNGRLLVPDGDTYSNNFLSILNTLAVLQNKPALKRKDAVWDLKSSLLTNHVDGYSKWYNFNASGELNTSSFYKKEGHFIFKKNENEKGEIYFHFDAAPLGYLAIAAHGHADALSVILHINGNPFLVDPGTYTYHTEEDWRNYFVSTRAHNTVTIDGADQAQHAGPTLWLDHFKVAVDEVVQTDNIESVTAHHTGYNKINCGHSRKVEFDRPNDTFTITDALKVKGEHEVNINWHLYPDINVTFDNMKSCFTLTNSYNKKIELIVDDKFDYQIVEGSVNPINGWYSNSFFKKQPSKTITGVLKKQHAGSINLTTVIKVS